jgi:serine protease SohB
MTEFLLEYGLFLAKTATVVAGILIIAGASITMSKRTRLPDKLEIKNLNHKFDQMQQVMKCELLSKKEWKKFHKEAKARLKAEKKQPHEENREKRIFVLNFHGDIKATAVASLREEITAVLTVAAANDEVVLRLENTGGLVHEHGLAASQLKRLRDAKVPLTVTVDKVAASGGYMMACVADRILAAPFAIVGSIGVLAQLPNFHDLMSRHGITFEQETAGEYKRTITMFGQNTEKERAKLREQIEETHTIFKDFIAEHRPALDLAKVATGEYWYGTKALELGLVDKLVTSDDYLLSARESARLFEVSYTAKKRITERLLSSVQSALARLTAGVGGALRAPLG